MRSIPCFLFTALLVPGLARAESSIVVSAELKSAMHGYMVFLDGAGGNDASNQPKRFSIAPGRHEVQVDLWTNPFRMQGTMQCKGLVTVPRDSELRVKCSLGGRFETIGASRNEPPPPPAYAPPPEAPRGDDAAELLSSAARRMREAPGACRRLGDDVRDLRDDLEERRHGRRGRHRLARESAELADEARDVCPRLVSRLLRDAAAVLGSYGDEVYLPPPPPRQGRNPPQPVPSEADQLDSIVATISAHSYSSDRLNALRQSTKGRGFSTSQIARLLQLFSYSNDRLAALKWLAPGATDPANAEPVLACFSYSTDRAAAGALLAR